MSCRTCELRPKAHSFYLLREPINQTKVFYSCPAKALDYWDGPGISKHIHGLLNEHEFPEWIWHIDAEDFAIKHAIEISSAMDIISLFRSTPEIGERLRQVTILNPNWYIRAWLTAIRPFLSFELQKKIVFSDAALSTGNPE